MIELGSSIWDVASSLMVFLSGGLIAILLSRRFESSRRRSLLLYAWHTLFSLFYIAFILTNGGDAASYFLWAKAGPVDFQLGTSSVVLLAWPLVNLLGLGFLGLSLAFQIFGFVGLLAFDASLRAAVTGRSRFYRALATFMVILPSVSLWSSGIGKDSLAFMATGLALWSTLKFNKRMKFMGIAIITMLIVRPHISALMVAAIVVSMMVQPRISLRRRITIGILAVAITGYVLPLAMNYSGLGSNAAISDFSSYVEDRQSSNMQGGSSIEISAMSLPMKLFTYIFRPLPFEAHNLTSFAASVDNLILLIVSIAGGWQFINRRRPRDSANRVFLWVYSLSAWLMLALTTANLGISVRQKWMFAPMLIYLCISVLGKPIKNAHNMKNRAGGRMALPPTKPLRGDNG